MLEQLLEDLLYELFAPEFLVAWLAGLAAEHPVAFRFLAGGIKGLFASEIGRRLINMTQMADEAKLLFKWLMAIGIMGIALTVTFWLPEFGAPDTVLEGRAPEEYLAMWLTGFVIYETLAGIWGLGRRIYYRRRGFTC